MASTLLLFWLLGIATPVALPSPTPSPCPRTLKFAGTLYLDADTTVPSSEVGPQVGTSDPNPTQCGLPDRLPVYRHTGHNSSDEVVYYVAAGQPELFRSAGSTGFPLQNLLPWLVLALVVGILLFAALPALLGHMRQPPIGAGGGEDVEPPDDERPPGN